MMFKFSIVVVDRIRSGLSVLTAAAQQGPDLAAKMAERIRPYLTEGEEVPDFGRPLELLTRGMRSRLNRVVGLEEKLYALLYTLEELRAERDRLIDTALRIYSRNRHILEVEFVAPRFDLLGHEPPPSKEIVALGRYVDNTVTLLTSPNVDKAMGESRIEPTFAPAARAAELQAVSLELGATSEKLTSVRREIDPVLEEKHEAMADYDTAFLPVARLFSACFLYVGNKELAKKLRPAARRPGRTVVETDPSLDLPQPLDTLPADTVPTDTVPSDTADENAQYPLPENVSELLAALQTLTPKAA